MAVRRRPVIQLPAQLANQIAAGEVVARPASVVKELLDNAVDAGAKRIQIAIEAGGSGRVEVVDDGHGMTEADARLALSRHATSKLRSVEDLHNILTLGFRGEALPSIASVSRFRLRTRVAENDQGVELRVEGGNPPDVRPCGCAVGSSIEVADLFFNVPARRKFLRTAATESAHISAQLRQAAMAHPGVGFELLRDGRQGPRWLAAGSRGERVEDVLGPVKLLHCKGTRGPMAIDAYLSLPDAARQGSAGLHFFVNQRPVRDRGLSRALLSAYGESLDRGRYPVGAVFIDLSPELVDVNVHPQKAEVRFAHPRAVSDALFAVLSAALAQHLQQPSHNRTASWLQPAARSAEAWSWRQSGPSAAAPPRANAATDRSNAPMPPRHAAEVGAGTVKHRGSPARQPAERGVRSPTPTPHAEVTRSALRQLGVVKQRYLIVETARGVCAIDVRVARAEQLLQLAVRELAGGRLVSQRVLFPLTRALPPAAVQRCERHQAALATHGFDVRPAGAKSVVVHAQPRLFTAAPAEQLVDALLAALGDDGLSDDASHSLLRSCGLLTANHEAPQPELLEQLLKWLRGQAGADRYGHGLPGYTSHLSLGEAAAEG